MQALALSWQEGVRRKTSPVDGAVKITVIGDNQVQVGSVWIITGELICGLIRLLLDRPQVVCVITEFSVKISDLESLS